MFFFFTTVCFINKNNYNFVVITVFVQILVWSHKCGAWSGFSLISLMKYDQVPVWNETKRNKNILTPVLRQMVQ